MNGFVKLAFGIVYTVGYLLFVIATVGGGHGTTMLASALPTWILFAACFVLLFWVEKRDARNAVAILMAFNYVMTAAFFFTIELEDGFQSTARYFEQEPFVLILGVGWYLVGQAIFWLFYYRGVITEAGGLP